MTEVFSAVSDILHEDGTLWLNLGDSYTSGGRKERDPGQLKIHPAFDGDSFKDGLRPNTPPGLKPKDLVGIPWRVAFALQAAGWYLRSDIIWHKPNPMPESVTDRPTKAHEYIFLMSKAERYYYDHEAVKENSITGDTRKPYAPGQVDKRGNGHDRGGGIQRDTDGTTRNKRTVWTVTTKPYPGAHFAVFPPELIDPCILAGTKEGDIVLDPFSGSATVGQVCKKHRRRYIGIELNEEYLKLSPDRIGAQGILL
jgi:DNA modification methylase